MHEIYPSAVEAAQQAPETAVPRQEMSVKLAGAYPDLELCQYPVFLILLSRVHL